MFGTGKEQIDQARLGHLFEICNHLSNVLDISHSVTMTIERHSRDYYTVHWQSTDHYGKAVEYIFSGYAIKEYKIVGEWRS